MLLACCKPCRPAGLFLWPLRWRTPGVRLQSPLPGKLIFERARVAELADAPDLGSGGETRGGSSPPFRTSAILLRVLASNDSRTIDASSVSERPSAQSLSWQRFSSLQPSELPACGLSGLLVSELSCS